MLCLSGPLSHRREFATLCPCPWSDIHVSTSSMPLHAYPQTYVCVSRTHVRTIPFTCTDPVFCLQYLCRAYTHMCIAPRPSPDHPWDSSLTLTFPPSPRQTIEFDGSAGAVLRIQPLRTPRDENVYECVAQNSVGEITVHAKLTVLRGIGFPRVCGAGPGAWFWGQIPKGSMKVLLWIITCGGL